MPYDVVNVFLGLAIFVQLQRVTDRWISEMTDRQTHDVNVNVDVNVVYALKTKVLRGRRSY